MSNMGLDIRIFEEVKVDGTWEYVKDFEYTNRNTFLFYILSGVGDVEDVDIISKPRGIPDDVSETVKNEYYEDHMGHSYLTVKEILNYDWGQTMLIGCGDEEDEEITFGEYVGSFYEGVVDLNSKYKDEVRLVFWFTY